MSAMVSMTCSACTAWRSCGAHGGSPATPTLINVNRSVIDRNHKQGEHRAPLRVKRGSRIDYAHEVALLLPDGTEVARFVYRPEDPLTCGARVWLETSLNLKLEVRRG